MLEMRAKLVHRKMPVTSDVERLQTGDLKVGFQSFAVTQAHCLRRLQCPAIPGNKAPAGTFPAIA